MGQLGFWSRLLVYVTNYGRLLTAKQGALNQLWACTALKSEIKSGAYYEPLGQEVQVQKLAGDVKLGTDLWEWTEEALEKVAVKRPVPPPYLLFC